MGGWCAVGGCSGCGGSWLLLFDCCVIMFQVSHSKTSISSFVVSCHVGVGSGRSRSISRRGIIATSRQRQRCRHAWRACLKICGTTLQPRVSQLSCHEVNMVINWKVFPSTADESGSVERLPTHTFQLFTGMSFPEAKITDTESVKSVDSHSSLHTRHQCSVSFRSMSSICCKLSGIWKRNVALLFSGAIVVFSFKMAASRTLRRTSL